MQTQWVWESSGYVTVKLFQWLERSIFIFRGKSISLPVTLYNFIDSLSNQRAKDWHFNTMILSPLNVTENTHTPPIEGV